MNIKAIYSLIAEADRVGHVPLIESKHGLGKSTIVAKYAADQELHFEPLMLSLLDTGDLLGIPRTENIGGQLTTTWAAPTWYSRIVDAAWATNMDIADLVFHDETFGKFVTKSYPDTIGRSELNQAFCDFYNKRNNMLHILRQDKVGYTKAQRSVLFLDEKNRAAPDILNASLQLILDKRLNDHILPTVNGQDTLIVSAINPADGDYTVSEFDPALLDRFVTCHLEPDTEAWLDYARTANVNIVVREYLTENPQKIHVEDKNGGKGASPRSWTRLGSYLDSIDNTPTPSTMDYIVGTIGEALGAEFFLFLQGFARTMTPEQWAKEVKKASRNLKDVKKIAAKLEETVAALEPIKRNELAANLREEYKEKDTLQDVMPYLVYLHAMPMENLAAYLTNLKEESSDEITRLAAFDKEASNKDLFRKVVATK